MLVVLGGLPGTGKTTIARRVARDISAVYLRIDTIEQAIRSAGVLSGDIGPAGYMVAYALAEANLRLGKPVVADSVNPLAVARRAWRAAAVAATPPVLEVEIVCSDADEHRRRVENRKGDVAGLVLPDWPAVTSRHYEPWTEPHLVIDTSRLSADEAAERIREALQHASGYTR